jgi:Uma2 family endonuclease
MTAAQLQTWISPEDYLAGENDREEGPRHEYVNGQVYAMVGVTRTHARITGNLFAFLHGALRGGPCEAFATDLKVRIQTATDERFYYPDIQVTCAEEAASHYNRAPCLIIEVLSPHTERVDRTEKLAAYQLIESLQEYVLVAQDRHQVEIHRRANAWRPEHLTDGDRLALPSVGVEVPVADIYA